MIHLPDAYWIPTYTSQVSKLLQNARSGLEKYSSHAFPAMTVFTPRFSPYSPTWLEKYFVPTHSTHFQYTFREQNVH